MNARWASSEGSSPLGASSRRTLVCGRSVWILTMMQSCASAAKLRAAGPILSVGIVCHVTCRFPPPRIVNRQSALNASLTWPIGGGVSDFGSSK